MTVPSTKVLSISNYQFASAGKYRVVQWIASEPYQLGDEASTINEALKNIGAANVTEIPAFNVSIYDDQGNEVKYKFAVDSSDVLRQNDKNQDDIAWLERLHKITTNPETDQEIREKAITILLENMPYILREAYWARQALLRKDADL